MSKEPIISVSGLRGIVGETLTPSVAVRYIGAFCASLPDGPVLISRDSRPSGKMLELAIQSAIMASGRDCLVAGISATPTTGVLVQEYKAAGGVQISASHNPSEYNGIKLFSNVGRVIPAGEGKQVLDAYRSEKTAWADGVSSGSSRSIEDTTSAHLERVLKTVDVESIRKQKFKVVLDSNRGAGAVLGRKLLEELHCEVTILGEQPDGNFEHLPEPTAVNLQGVSKKAKDLGADVTFCQDPDADRLAIIDENGRYIGEECTLAICIEHALANAKLSGPIVTNCSTSRMSEDLANRFEMPFSRSAVGEANVVDEMLAKNALLGGEGNGGLIDPRIVLVRDSFSGMAQTLAAMAATQSPLSVLADNLPQYAIHKSTVSVAQDEVPAALDRLEKEFPEATPDRLDGLRLDWPNQWLLVRASNTEPIVRIVAECPTLEIAKSICERASKAIEANS